MISVRLRTKCGCTRGLVTEHWRSEISVPLVVKPNVSVVESGKTVPPDGILSYRTFEFEEILPGGHLLYLER